MQRTNGKPTWNDAGDCLRQLLIAGISGDEKHYLSGICRFFLLCEKAVCRKM